ncbi:MAG TPA: hydroxyectoine utilization dehydratase EutB [Devosiaceae bacterium]
MPVVFTDILAARQRIAPHIHRTRLGVSVSLGDRFGVGVRLKLEHQQVTGSFKLRGATNAVLSLDRARREAGVATASTGNHGRAVAHAARISGTRAVVCMSELVPENKVQAVKALGAEVRIVGRSQDDAQAEVDRLVAEEGLTAIPPFDDELVIAGQGTLGLEMLEDAPGLSMLVVPLSGGGLISGVALAAKTVNPSIHVVGVSMERGAAMAQSLKAGHPVDVREEPTLADSLGGGVGLQNRHTFAMVQRLVDECILLTEAEIAQGVRYAYEQEGEILEGGGAVGIAALVCGKLRPRGETGLVLSGRNIAADLHRRIVNGERIEA